MNRPVVSLVNLGRVDYREAYKLQARFRDRLLGLIQRKSSEGQNGPEGGGDALLLVEHNPVYTVGIRSKDYSLETETTLRALGADFVRTNRGGLITFHGPGQLVAYPVFYLGHFHAKRSIKWFVHQLEATVIGMCRSILTDESRTISTLPEYPGVWINGQRKVAALGVHASRYVTTHGVAINSDINLSWFDHITPCGIVGKEVTSLSRELGRSFGVKEALPHFLNAFRDKFNCDLVETEIDAVL